MPFLFLCAILAFCFQLFALRVSTRRWVHILTFALLELPPLLMPPPAHTAFSSTG